MTDRITKEHRSWNMSRIRSGDTGPEKVVRSVLHGMGYRFRLHVKKLPGKPDIVLPKHKTIILVHGCFWHRHQNCKYAYTPKSRTEFWNKKFELNVNHDQKIRKALKELGWKLITVWSCQTIKKEVLQRYLEKTLK